MLDTPRYPVDILVLSVDLDLTVASGSVGASPKQVLAFLLDTREEELLTP